MIAIVVGGTGLTGSFLIRELIADSTIKQIISVSRKSAELQSPKLAEILISDLKDLWSLESKLVGDLYFSCLGTTIKAAGSKENFFHVDHDAIVAFGGIAKKQNAKSFTLVSSMGANSASLFFYNQVKGQTENDLKALGLRSLIIMRPALLTGPRKDFRLAESLLSKTLIPASSLLPSPIKKSLVTDAQQVAKRMLVEGKRALEGTHVISAQQI